MTSLAHSETLSRIRLKRLPISIVHIGSIFILFGLTALLFIPFGFRNKPLVEEWMFIDAFTHGEGFFYIYPLHYMRPLLAGWTYLGFILDPVGLNGFTILLFALIVLKAIAVYALGLVVLRRGAGLALLIAVLFTVYPADAGIYNFRALGIHAAALLYFVAVYAFVELARRPKFSLWFAALLVVALIWGLLTYEGAYVLVVATPALLWVLPPAARPNARRSTVFWYATFAVTVVLTIYSVSRAPQNYESTLFSMPSVFQAAEALTLMLVRQFVAGWFFGAQALAKPLWLMMGLMTGIPTLVFLYRIYRRPAGRITRRWLLLGLVVVVFGYVIYLPTYLRLSDWRLAYYSSAGGALVMVALLYSIRSRLVVSLLGGALIMLGTAQALQQYDNFARTSDVTQQLLTQTVEQVPVLTEDTYFVYLNTPEPTNCHEWYFYHHGFLVDALRFTYHSDEVVGAEVLGYNALRPPLAMHVITFDYQDGRYMRTDARFPDETFDQYMDGC